MIVLMDTDWIKMINVNMTEDGRGRRKEGNEQTFCPNSPDCPNLS